MNRSLFLAALCLGITSAAPRFNQSLDSQWFHWKAEHKKLYGENEMAWRRELWESNLRMIEQHNWEFQQGKHSFTLGMNSFGDMTNEEFKEAMIGFQSQKHGQTKLFKNVLRAKIPSSVDWRRKGYVTPVKDQGKCGSCWAFSTTGTLEGQMFKKTGKLVSLSEQNLVDCSVSQGNIGCSGGLMNNAYRYIMDNGGLESEQSYPYEAEEGECRYNPKYSVANVTGFVDVPQNEKALMEAVATVGPISVGIDAMHDTFRFYNGGIYYEPNCSSESLGHAVLVVGYGSEGRGPSRRNYWIVKNSWGKTWGLNGYVKMSKDMDNNCGIATSASYPTV
ncbi:procathepsin L-like [Erinaceus europaeus]|uniref:Procathepsin L-like n=1 Tax=Erinaceus europaeus TaxID=9365 RepID=A0A1S3AS25_ERIEU|nr:procathepsin L-like [Erinaceus europaeus]